MKHLNKKNKVLTNMYLFVLLPMIVIIPFAIISSVYINNFYTESIEDKYSEKFERISGENEIMLQSIAKSIYFLQNDDSFINTMKGGADKNEIEHSIFQINKIIENYSIIEDIVITDKGVEKVYTVDGTFGMEEFFNKRYIYSAYDSNYWYDYKAPYSQRQVLPPTQVYANDESKMVIPIVFTRIDNVYFSNYLIVNVSIQEIIKEMMGNLVAEEAVFGIVNGQTLELFGDSGEPTKISNDFWLKIAQRGTKTFQTDFNNKESLVISYSPENAILPYTYVAAIPKEIIDKPVASLIGRISLVWVLVFLVIMIISVFSANTLYSPVKRLVSVIEKNSNKSGDKSGNEFTIIHDFIEHTQGMINNYLPIIHEQELLEFLNETSLDLDEKETKFREIDLQFEHNYFCIILFRIRFTRNYYRNYTKMQTDNIMKNILEVICSMFPDDYKVYTLPMKSDKLHILLNIDENVNLLDIENVLNEFLTYLEQDKELIHLNITIGGIYKGLNGLKQSYNEALREAEGIATQPNEAAKELQFISRTKKCVFDDLQENTLTNYLLSAQVQPAREFINALIRKNVSNGVSAVSMFNLYMRIANTILNVMRLKQISYEGDKIDDIDIVTKFFMLPPEDLREAIELMLDTIETNITIPKIDITDIVLYIQNNYMEDLSLELIADKYKTTSAYLSRVFKETTSINFTSYLKNLRINKAKELLKNTDISIDEISKNTGFGSRNTFTRVFGSSVGMTPTQYRKSATYNKN